MSHLLKRKNPADLAAWLKTSDMRDHKQAMENSEFRAQCMPMFVKPKPDEEGNMPEEPAPLCYVQDLVHDNELFAWAGITFGKEISYLLQKSIKVLAASTQAQSIRFFGKITALTGDYYIVEATVEGGEGEGDGENADPTVEAAGTGVNKYTYFVTMSPFQKWNKLPNLTPSILATTRKISYLLKGDLEAKIYSNPVFFG